MAQANSLTPETFLAVAEMIAGHLRLKEADRWSAHICRLKFHSFTSEFPEINEPQFMWAAEQWIQATDAGTFLRYPTWGELMAALYRTEAGRANRSWGPREGLPGFVRFKPEQLALLPNTPRSLVAVPDQQNIDAYRTVGRAGEAEAQGLPLQPVVEPALLTGSGLSDEEWQAYLAQLPEEATCSS
jgi:hypothetical protein